MVVNLDIPLFFCYFIPKEREGNMSEERKPRVVDGVHFVWVPYYEESFLNSHWLSISHPWTVRVFEPKNGEEEWSAILYKPGKFVTSGNPDYYSARYDGTQKIAWLNAVVWAKNGA